MRCALIFAWVAGLAAGTESEPSAVLRRAREKVLESAEAIPHYTCVQTVRREYFEPAAASIPRDCKVLLEQRRHPTLDIVLRPYATDRLRLDVTMASTGEIFSWAGASRFEDADIGRVVRSGPMATGSFGGFLIAVFKTDVKRFDFERTLEERGRTLMEYSFAVAQADSHYALKLYNSWLHVPYNGIFQVDAQTAELVRMSVSTGEIPPATGICLTTTRLDFASVKIGDGEFLLPQQVSQRFVYPSVEEAENTTVFTNCREFRGESTVTFGVSEAGTGGSRKTGSAPVRSLPGGLRFSLSLTTAIAADTAAAGDPFTAKLVDPLRDYNGKTLAPKGALVEGRLLRVQSFVRPPEVVVVLKPEWMWIRGERVKVNAVRDYTYLVAERQRKRRGVEILLPLRGEDNSGAFRFSGEHATVPVGYQSDWKTLPAAGAAR